MTLTEISEDIQSSGADELKLLVGREQLRVLCISVKKSMIRKQQLTSQANMEEDWTDEMHLRIESDSEEETIATN